MSAPEQRLGPTIQRGKSAQDIATPWEFIAAVEAKFGTLQVDLAATAANAKAPFWITPEEDSLTVPWHKFNDGLLWLNPPFDPVEPWIRKCVAEAKLGAHILLLTRSGLGTNWWWKNISEHAEFAMIPAHIITYQLTPRIKFEGAKDVYPADLMLTTFNIGHWDSSWLRRWKWR